GAGAVRRGRQPAQGRRAEHDPDRGAAHRRGGMTSDGSVQLPYAGPGPVPPSLLFSDRAGHESVGGHTAIGPDDPLTRALRTLDSILESEGSGPAAAPTTAAPAGTGTTGASGADPRTGPPGTSDPVDPADDQRGVVAAPDPAAEDEHPPTPGQERREAILDGASALFAERGYHGASLRDISRRVGISHPGMLHHFASKDVLLGAVIDRLEAHAQGLLDATVQLSTSLASLEEALGGPWNPTQHPMALLATLSAETVDPDHPGRFRIARLRLVHEHVIESVLTNLAEGGYVAGGADPAFVARSTFSLLLS